jgi:eukaryotic-like serine/threonine-protein kinase
MGDKGTVGHPVGEGRPVPLPDRPDWTGGCPNRDMLAAYTLGSLHPELLETVAAHLSSCPHCEASLDQVAPADDPLIQNLKRFLAREPGPNGPRTSADHLAATADERPRRPDAGILGPLPWWFGPYELLQKLGQGGMGVVFKARQLRPQRLVALKIALGAPQPGSEAHARFLTESDAIARLQHDHIVRIFECGEQDGLCYFSMEYIEGGSLAKRLAGQPLPDRDAAGLVRTLAHAVDFAHRHHVIHRDLKPANVLLGADGAVKLTDFGLAKLLDFDSGQTQTDAILGTASYMAPEQAEGKIRVVGPRTDVYGLGAILYETLTGDPPFRAGTRAKTIEQVRSQPPVPPSRLRPGLAPELEAVCLACLEKNPAARYPSAAALAEDLDRWLRGEATLARPRGWIARRWAGVRRHALAWSVAALIGFAVLAGAAIVQYTDPDRPIKAIERELARGRTVSLIGPTGGPRWSRWRLQSDTGPAPTPRDKAFLIQSWGCSLLELVRDPQTESYRLTAEVRHEASANYGEVGLYLAHRETSTPAGTVHQFIQLSFNGIDQSGAEKMVNQLRGLNKPPLPNPVDLQMRFFAEGGRRGLWDSRISGASRRLFVPNQNAERTWRKLVLEVTPQEIRAYWEGDQLVGPLAFAKISQQTEAVLASVRSQESFGPLAQSVRADFPPRGGMGLYVFHGCAAFRAVELTPF